MVSLHYVDLGGYPEHLLIVVKIELQLILIVRNEIHSIEVPKPGIITNGS